MEYSFFDDEDSFVHINDDLWCEQAVENEESFDFNILFNNLMAAINLVEKINMHMIFNTFSDNFVNICEKLSIIEQLDNENMLTLEASKFWSNDLKEKICTLRPLKDIPIEFLLDLKNIQKKIGSLLKRIKEERQKFCFITTNDFLIMDITKEFVRLHLNTMILVLKFIKLTNEEKIIKNEQNCNLILEKENSVFLKNDINDEKIKSIFPGINLKKISIKINPETYKSESAICLCYIFEKFSSSVFDIDIVDIDFDKYQCENIYKAINRELFKMERFSIWNSSLHNEKLEEIFCLKSDFTDRFKDNYPALSNVSLNEANYSRCDCNWKLIIC
jgi:hypothetical protein